LATISRCLPTSDSRSAHPGCHRSVQSELTLRFGVIRAFLDADLLPRVITGTSAGGLVAALLCTRTNDELKELLVPELADKITACEDSFRVWFSRWRKTGARFSSVEWARKVNLSHKILVGEGT
jgi:predicted acylesterase/phospholipase RssA